MSATDVTDGNSEGIASGGNDEEAAWLDLIGRFDAPADSADSPAPWPERENLFPPGQAGASAAGQASAADDAGAGTGQGAGAGTGQGAASAKDGMDSGGPARDHAAAEDRGGPADSREAPAGGDAAGSGAGAGPATPWPERENLPPPAPRSSDLGRWAGGRPGMPVYRRFELPAPADPRSWTTPDREEDEEDEGHYTPPPPPPLPSMSPVTKGAWVALFGGPAYLLTATLASWSVAGWALFLAIAAFIGGFTVLALRLGDRPDDQGPDDGAVI